MLRRFLFGFVVVVVLMAVLAPEHTPQIPRRSSPDPEQFGDLKTVGKLFFESGGEVQACTATSVVSPHKNLIATSARCLVDRRTGKPVNHPLFVPYYQERNQAPYGMYPVHGTFIHPKFFEDDSYSYAFATVFNGVPLGNVEGGFRGQNYKDLGRLGDNVGGQGIRWNHEPASSYFAFGYPEGPHPDGTQTFSGDRIEWCHGRPRSIVRGSSRVPKLGIDCDFTAGGTGSPILAEYDDGRRSGYLDGIVDLSYDTDKDGRIDFVTFSYFDSSVAELYEAARKCWTPSVASTLTEGISPCPGSIDFPPGGADLS